MDYRDSTQLLFLRARYYNPADARFISRDTWAGYVNNPLSLNRWMYVEGNPVNLVDPTGNYPTGADVKNGRAIYSCKCGWIDIPHASTENALRLFRILAQENKQLNNVPFGYRTDLFVASPVYNEIALVSEGNRTMNAVIKSGLGSFTKKAVAHSVYRAIHEKVENAQGWFTSYSFEDLTSDEIGFYLTLRFNLNENLNITKNQSIRIDENPEAWNWLAEKCGFEKDRRTAIQNSINVYNNMGGSRKLFFDTPHVYEWGSPMFFKSCEAANLCGNISRSWPLEFKAVPPLPGNRKSLWWEYDISIDGPKFESSFSGFSFLGKDN